MACSLLCGGLLVHCLLVPLFDLHLGVVRALVRARVPHGSREHVAPRLQPRLQEQPRQKHNLEDVEDVVDQAMDDAKEYISLLDGIVQENRSYRDNKMNDILFFLTRVTTIVVPAQFLTGLYGMNFVRPDGTPNMPELEWDYGYVYFWCLVVFLTIVSTIYMSRLQI